jgi:hypothetical protein
MTPDDQTPPPPPALDASSQPLALTTTPAMPAIAASPPRASLTAAQAPGTGAGRGSAGSSTSRRAPDAVCSGAVALARQAAVDVAGEAQVGDPVGLDAEGDRVVTHHFACLSAGYRGWRWAVTVSRVPRARTATVSEVVLLPGPTAVLAPTWLPWSDRVAPGDLGAADQLPMRVDDPNLEPGYTAVDDEEADRLALWELGLGRARVLSFEGRAELSRRWYRSERGPTGDEAVHAAAACSSCGYFLPLAGALRQVFGVCGNEWSPSEARVVSVDHGCGAHSETDIDREEPEVPPPPILDETGYEAIVLPPRDGPTEPAADGPTEPAADGPTEPAAEVDVRSSGEDVG